MVRMGGLLDHSSANANCSWLPCTH